MEPSEQVVDLALGVAAAGLELQGQTFEHHLTIGVRRGDLDELVPAEEAAQDVSLRAGHPVQHRRIHGGGLWEPTREAPERLGIQSERIGRGQDPRSAESGECLEDRATRRSRGGLDLVDARGHAGHGPDDGQPIGVEHEFEQRLDVHDGVGTTGPGDAQAVAAPSVVSGVPAPLEVPAMSAPLPRRTVIGGLVLGIVAVSASAVLTRVAMGDEPQITRALPGFAPALAVAFWRSALGSLVLAPLAVRERRRAASPLPVTVRRLLLLSGVALGLHFALWLGSLALTTVAASVTLVTVSPIFVALGGRWFLSEEVARRTWFGMALTIVGALVIGLADASGGDAANALLGDAMALGGSLAVSGYMLLGRRLRRDVGAMAYAATVYGWAAAVLLVICIATGTPLWGYGAGAWLAILGILVGPQLLGHTIFNTLLASVSATIVALVIVAEPVTASLLAWLFLAELPAPLFWFGAPLVLVGVVVATSRSRTRAAVPV